MSHDNVHDVVDVEPVVVIGAGPVGLAAAAHLLERGLEFLVLEAGDAAGASVARWGHVRLFSPWQYNVDDAARRLLEASGVALPDPASLPTGAELVDAYLRPLSRLASLAARIRYNADVVAISRDRLDRVSGTDRAHAPFVVRLADGEEMTAGAVIDATGTWRTPNVLGANGLPAFGEDAASPWIDYALPDVLGTDRATYANRHTVVVGAGHSAATTLLALSELKDVTADTRVTWALRAPAPDAAYCGGADDELPARGALGSGLRVLVQTGRVDLVTRFAEQGIDVVSPVVKLRGSGDMSIDADRIVAATGYRPDWGLTRELRVDLDPIVDASRQLAPLIDPNVHSCGTVYAHGVDEVAHPEPGYFAVGAKSYGRAPTFLMATGYEQIRSVVAALAGDWVAARERQLDLPATGVCSVTHGLHAITAELGLSADLPDKLMSATARHVSDSATPGQAVLAAADELHLDHSVALRFAAFATEQDSRSRPAGDE